ncbi:MAG: hypothetical protein Q9178_001663 [Gyalolechia marmorata]
MDHAINPQIESPLFTRIPPEVRNQIFKFALTAYEDPASRKYSSAAYYYRPGYTRPHRIDTELLLTCRRVYWETYKFPASINEHTSWYSRAPPNIKKNHLSVDNRRCSLVRRRDLRTVHVFAQQIWLEGDGFAGFTGLWQYARPTTLVITLRHSDWWWWEDEAPLTFDPKQEGKASPEKNRSRSAAFALESWGNQFRKIKGLQRLQLELETVANKKQELDAIVDRADGWEFPLANDRILHLNKSKTRRTGWIGTRLTEYRENSEYDEGEDGEVTVGSQSHPDIHSTSNTDAGDSSTSTGIVGSQHVPVTSGASILRHTNDQEDEPTKAKRVLEAAGVIFDVFDDGGSVKRLPAHRKSVYYIVTLIWEA